MSLETLAQLICFNPRGATLTTEEEDFITRHRVGAFVLFARNIPSLESAQHLIARIHALAPQPLIAVDQEGGRVIRLPTPATHFPSAMALGATGSPDLAFRAGQATARELLAMNLNVALAPVMDVNSEPANPVIGTRAFGDTPAHVSLMGVAWLSGLRSEGVIACAKHFPGHGDTHVDSHDALPRIGKARAELERVELAPFRAAIEAGVEMVMPGHLLVTALDDERASSLSRTIITELLRHTMGFEGVIITDALDMHAVAYEYGIPGAAVEAVRAGCDLVCPIVLHDKTLLALQRAVDDGRLSLQQIEASVQRIQRLRAKAAALLPANPAWLGANEHRALAQQIAQQAIRANGQLLQTVNARKHLGVPLSNATVVEFALGKATIAEGASYGAGRLLAALKKETPTLKGLALPFDPDEAAAQHALTLAQSAYGLVVVTRQALHFSAQQKLAQHLLALKKPTILIALRDPYDLALFPDARCAVAAYDDSPAIVEQLVRWLHG